MSAFTAAGKSCSRCGRSKSDDGQCQHCDVDGCMNTCHAHGYNQASGCCSSDSCCEDSVCFCDGHTSETSERLAARRLVRRFTELFGTPPSSLTL